MSEDETSEDDLFLDRITELYYETPDENEDIEWHTLQESHQNRYVDDELIATGGMKEIYKVRDIKTGRHVAFAKIKKGLPEELYDSFLREAKLTSLLEHPNIITVHDIGIDPERGPFFTMELKTGMSFNEKLNGPLKDRQELYERLTIFLKVCDAIEFAHSKKVIHLDLKPSNIQLGDYGEVVVCDWGLGKLIGSTDYDGGDLDRLTFNPDFLNQMTLSGQIKGTPGYMAPEQVKKNMNKTEKTDIYSLGAILFHIIYRSPPTGGDLNIVIEETIHGSWYCPKEKKYFSLQSVALKALSVDPEQRYKTIKELKKEIQKFMNGYATQAEGAGIWKEAQLFFQRNKKICYLSMGFILFLLLTMSTFIFFLNQSRHQTIDSLNIAKKEKKAAELFKEEAEKNLDLYLNSKTQHATRIFKSSKLMFTDYFKNPNLEIHHALKKMNEAKKLSPNDLSIQRYIGDLHFLKQDFDSAYQIYSESDLSNSMTVKIAKEYRHKNDESKELLELVDLNEVIRLLTKNHWRHNFVEQFLAYDHQNRKGERNYLPSISWFLRKNSNNSGLDFHYNSKDKSLKFDTPNLYSLLVTRQYGSSLSILRFLDIEKLDISHTQVSQLSDLNGILFLDQLNISHTLITDLSPLEKLNVRRLIINKGQFSKNVLEKAQKWVQIVIE